MTNKLLFMLIVFSLCGCDIFSPSSDGKTEISGVVINESTGEVVPNLSSVIEKIYGGGCLGCWRGYLIVVQTKTDNNGNFRLFYDDSEEKSSLLFHLNKGPYNKSYSVFWQEITPGAKLKNRNYFVYQNTTLKVSLKSQIQLKPRTYTLWLPGIGTSIDTVAMTTRAKGEFL